MISQVKWLCSVRLGSGILEMDSIQVGQPKTLLIAHRPINISIPKKENNAYFSMLYNIALLCHCIKTSSKKFCSVTA